jgi:hypothetical protein
LNKNYNTVAFLYHNSTICRRRLQSKNTHKYYIIYSLIQSNYFFY